MRIIHLSDFHLDFNQIRRCKDLVDRMSHCQQVTHKMKAIGVIVYYCYLIDYAGYIFPVPKMENGFKRYQRVKN